MITYSKYATTTKTIHYKAILTSNKGEYKPISCSERVPQLSMQKSHKSHFLHILICNNNTTYRYIKKLSKIYFDIWSGWVQAKLLFRAGASAQLAYCINHRLLERCGPALHLCYTLYFSLHTYQIHFCFVFVLYIILFLYRIHFCLGIFFYIILFSAYLSYIFSTLHRFIYTFCISASLLCIFCTLMSITCTRTLLCIFVLSIFYFAVSLSKHFRALPCFTVIFCYTYLML